MTRWTSWRYRGACGGQPQELIEAYLARAERTRRQQEMTIAIVGKGLVFYQVLESRTLSLRI